MNAEHRAAKHITSTLRMIEQLCEQQKISSVNQITADRVTRYAEKLKVEGKLQRTVHAYLTAIKSFTRYLVHNGVLPTDPLIAVKKPSPARKNERRFLQPDEYTLLAKTTKTGPDRYGLSGEERMLLYDLAVQTGLRHNEIRSLKATDLHLDGKEPHVRVSAGSTKNRKAAKQYILADLASRLKKNIARKVPSASVFALPEHKKVPQMLREDLEAARTEWLAKASNDPKVYRKREQSDFLLATNHAGQDLDFHSLRHTCGAWASIAGASPKAVQTLMRHSSIVLTLDTYGHLMPDEAAGTVQRMAAFMPGATTKKKTRRKTLVA